MGLGPSWHGFSKALEGFLWNCGPCWHDGITLLLQQVSTHISYCDSPVPLHTKVALLDSDLGTPLKHAELTVLFMEPVWDLLFWRAVAFTWCLIDTTGPNLPCVNISGWWCCNGVGNGGFFFLSLSLCSTLNFQKLPHFGESVHLLFQYFSMSFLFNFWERSWSGHFSETWHTN